MAKNASTGGITSKIATSAPASARPSANARPQPRAPPVTRAVRPLSENYSQSQRVKRSKKKFYWNLPYPSFPLISVPNLYNVIKFSYRWGRTISTGSAGKGKGEPPPPLLRERPMFNSCVTHNRIPIILSKNLHNIFSRFGLIKLPPRPYPLPISKAPHYVIANCEGKGPTPLFHTTTFIFQLTWKCTIES